MYGCSAISPAGPPDSTFVVETAGARTARCGAAVFGAIGGVVWGAAADVVAVKPAGSSTAATRPVSTVRTFLLRTDLVMAVTSLREPNRIGYWFYLLNRVKI